MAHPRHNLNDRPDAARRRSRWIVLGALGILLGTAVGLLVVGRMLADGLQPVGRVQLAAARQRWSQHGPASYDMELRIGGRRAGLVRVEVRQGEVTHLVRDGDTPSQRRTWQYWSVPGLFDMIEQDLDSADEPAGGFGTSGKVQAVLRGEFDTETGLPLRYRRFLVGTPLDVEWEVTRFAVVAAPAERP